MKMLKISLAVLASLSTIGVASAAPTPVVLDNWMAPQSVTANSAVPVSSTLSAPVFGAAPFLGDRTLTATLTSATGSVDAVIGGGTFECNLSVTATGFCVPSFVVLNDFILDSVEYGATNDGAFGGTASVTFYKNMVAIASESIAVGSGNYSTWLGNTSFSAGDNFAIAWMGTRATDKLMTLVTSNVPEPGSLALAGLGLLGLGVMRRRSVA